MDFQVSSTCGVGVHHRLHVITGEAQLVSEEEGPDKRQFFKLLQSNGVL